MKEGAELTYVIPVSSIAENEQLDAARELFEATKARLPEDVSEEVFLEGISAIKKQAHLLFTINKEWQAALAYSSGPMDAPPLSMSSNLCTLFEEHNTDLADLHFLELGLTREEVQDRMVQNMRAYLLNIMKQWAAKTAETEPKLKALAASIVNCATVKIFAGMPEFDQIQEIIDA